MQLVEVCSSPGSPLMTARTPLCLAYGVTPASREPDRRPRSTRLRVVDEGRLEPGVDLRVAAGDQEDDLLLDRRDGLARDPPSYDVGGRAADHLDGLGHRPLRGRMPCGGRDAGHLQAPGA